LAFVISGTGHLKDRKEAQRIKEIYLAVAPAFSASGQQGLGAGIWEIAAPPAGISILW
jgi:hypothetical protein